LLQRTRQAAVEGAHDAAPKAVTRGPLASHIGNQAQLRRLEAKSAPADLRVGPVDDPLEREADAVADRVMRMPEPGIALARAPLQVSRKCADCAEEEEKKKLQRKATAQHAAPGEAPAIVHDALRATGQPLDPATRAYFEPRFGYDFSDVRIHTGPSAETSAQAVHALAYTVGQNVVFNAGQYSPQTNQGQRLLAHELTHVVQQRSGAALRLQRDHVKEQQEPGQYSPTAFLRSSWKEVNDLGIAYQEKADDKHPGGATVLDAPSGKQIAHLDQNAKVFILREGIVGGDRWYAVVVKDTGVFGYIQREFIWRNLPDPGSVVIKIHSGESPLEIAARHYTGKGFDQWGKDKRYVVNALVYVNQQAKHNTKDSPGLEKQEGVDAPWFEATARADRYIWLPSAEYLNAIYGEVKEHGGGTGSPSYDFVDFVKSLAHKAIYGVAFLGGIVHGIFQSLWDTLSGLANAVYEVFKSLFTLHIVSDIEELSDKISKLKWEDIKKVVQDWAGDWHEKLTSDSPWTAGHAHGYLTGYVMAEAFMLLVGAGEIEAAKTAFWGTEAAKAIRGTNAFKKLAGAAEHIAALGDRAADLAGKVGNIIKKTPLVGKAVAVTGKVIEFTLKGVLAILHLPQKWARAIAEQILRSPGLKRLLPRIEELSEQGQKWLFGCFNPCKWEAEGVEKTLEKLDKKAIEAEAEAAERSKTAPHKDDPAAHKAPEVKVGTDPDAAVSGGQKQPDPIGAAKPSTPTTFKSAKEDLIEQLRTENRRLSTLARADEPASKTVRESIDRLRKESSRLATEIATDEKKYNRATLARNPGLKPQFDRVQKLRTNLETTNATLKSAEKELDALTAKQAPLREEMRKNREEIDRLNKPDRELDPKERGRVNEVRALKDEGLDKQTKVAITAQDPDTREWVTTIPDAMLDNGATVDVKDVNSLSETQQLRVQRSISNRRRPFQKPVIITGEHTYVPDEMKRNYIIIRKTYLGPQK
jgi:hypothetical protein